MLEVGAFNKSLIVEDRHRGLVRRLCALHRRAERACLTAPAATGLLKLHANLGNRRVGPELFPERDFEKRTHMIVVRHRTTHHHTGLARVDRSESVERVFPEWVAVFRKREEIYLVGRLDVDAVLDEMDAADDFLVIRSKLSLGIRTAIRSPGISQRSPRPGKVP